MRTRFFSIVAGAMAVVFLAGCGGQGVVSDEVAAPAVARPATPAQPQFVPGQILIKFEAGATASQRNQALERAGAAAEEHIYTAAMKRSGDQGWVLARTAKPVETAISELKAMPGVVYAEPNWIYNHDATSNDTYYVNGGLWGMYGDASSPANQYGSQAAEAWAAGHTGSTSIYIANIDEGQMYNHTDLNGQFWTNPFDPADGVDNDGNGYVDDIRGWDFDGNNNTTFDGTQDDHGTHTAGTIGAKGGNATGVVGVSWNITMISCKFLGRRGGTTANAIKAFDYVTDLKTRHGLDIVASNNSWGGGGFSQALFDAIQRHGNAGILAICAAGNGGSDGVGDNNDTTPHYPSSYSNSNIIAVASITSSGARSSFSNYGATSVDIAAPGSSVTSTLPGSGGSSGYGTGSGTSMATPHVTGAAALYAATHPDRGAALKAVILNSAIPTASMSGRCVTGGRLNAGGF